MKELKVHAILCEIERRLVVESGEGIESSEEEVEGDVKEGHRGIR